MPAETRSMAADWKQACIGADTWRMVYRKLGAGLQKHGTACRDLETGGFKTHENRQNIYFWRLFPFKFAFERCIT